MPKNPQCIPKASLIRPQCVSNTSPMRPQRVLKEFSECPKSVPNASPMRPQSVPKAFPKLPQSVLKASPMRLQAFLTNLIFVTKSYFLQPNSPFTYNRCKKPIFTTNVYPTFSNQNKIENKSNEIY